MEISTFELEKILASNGYDFIVGTDEVGRGPLCGPVVAAAVAFKDINFQMPAEFQKEFDLIRDSKKLSEKQREYVFDFIKDHFHVGIGLCDHETIDRINILEASFLAMKKAVQELSHNLKLETGNDGDNGFTLHDSRCVILVDGNKEIPNFSFEQQAVVGGDRIVKSISAASIVAKVTRDRMMKEFALKYPLYGFNEHMGYGTRRHMEALRKYGPCEIHRRSFAPVRDCLKRELGY